MMKYPMADVSVLLATKVKLAELASVGIVIEDGIVDTLAPPDVDPLLSATVSGADWTRGTPLPFCVCRITDPDEGAGLASELLAGATVWGAEMKTNTGVLAADTVETSTVLAASRAPTARIPTSSRETELRFMPLFPITAKDGYSRGILQRTCALPRSFRA